MGSTIYEHEMIKTKLEIQKQAQKNIIQEIHDNIGQILSLAKLHLATLDFEKPEEVVQKTFNSNQLLGKAIKDLRTLTKYLDAEYINRIGLVKSLEHELAFLPAERTLKPVITVTGSPKPLRKEEELILFRIVQEVTGWLIKKSDASLLSVTIQYGLADLWISIRAHETDHEEEKPDEDDPVIKSIQQRSFIIDAGLQILYINNNETAINITLPIKDH